MDTEYRAHLERMNDLNWERFRAELRASLAELREELRSEISDKVTGLRAEMHRAIAAQNRLMFGYWLTTMLAIAGMFLQLNKR